MNLQAVDIDIVIEMNPQTPMGEISADDVILKQKGAFEIIIDNLLHRNDSNQIAQCFDVFDSAQGKAQIVL